jgi:AraC-like DNA-binding protein
MAAPVEGVRRHAANFTDARRTPRHVHHEYVFSLVVEGPWEIECGHCKATHIIEKGDLLLTEAHEVYAGRALGEPPWRRLSINISRSKILSLFDYAADENQISLPHFTPAAVSDPSLRRLFLALYESLNDDRTALERESRLLDWTSSLRRHCAPRSESLESRRVYRETAAVRRVREFISESFADNIRLPELAKIAGLSAFHLNRVFASQVGLPPHEYQNQLRIEAAGRLLAQNKTYAEVALETGFSDQSHFIRFFKRYTGVTPKNFLAR